MGNVEVANSAKVGVSGRVGYDSDFFFSVIKLIVAKGLALGLILKVSWSYGTRKWRTNTPQVMTSGDKQLVPVTKVRPSSGEDSGTTFGRSLKIVGTFVMFVAFNQEDPMEKSQGT